MKNLNNIFKFRGGFMFKAVTSSKIPAAIGPYSAAIDTGNTIYVSGQLPINPEIGKIVDGGIKEQTTQSLTNVKAVLEAAGYSMANVAKTTVFLADIQDFAAMNEVYGTFFEAPYPARCAYQVAALPQGAKVEIEVIAVK